MTAHMTPQIRCEAPGCPQVYVGELDRSITSTRTAAAKEAGWVKTIIPSPMRIVDYCPAHNPGSA